jgi:flagellar motor switch protein FliM
VSKILSQEEIDALLTNVAKTQSFDDLDDSRERTVHIYDFKHPDRISKDQLRTLRTVHDGFARTFATHLSSTLRTMVDVNLLSIDQVAYSEYMMALSEPSCIYIISSKSLKGSAIIEIGTNFALIVVDRLLGGPGKKADQIREVTVIEQNILKKIIEKALVILNDVWQHVTPMNLYLESFETNPQFVQIAPASETAAVVFFEIVLRDQAYPFNLCFPYFVIEPLLQSLSSQSWSLAQKKMSKIDRRHIQSRMSLTALPMTVRMDSTTIKLRQLMNLKKGDILQLEMKQGKELPVVVQDKIKFFGQVGVVGKKKAIKILRSVTPEEEIIYE